MNAFNNLMTSMTSDILSATQRLHDATDESWSFDWENAALSCRHGVKLAHWEAIRRPASALREYVSRQHIKDNNISFQKGFDFKNNGDLIIRRWLRFLHKIRR